jgi:uncharacterized protein (TIGR02099 family)
MRWKAWGHRFTRVLGWTVGVAVIALAISAALAQVLLPLLAKHPQWVAQELSDKLQRPVSFASLDGRWEPSGPRFIMRNVVFGATDGGTPLHVPEVDLKLDFGGWLLPSRHLLNLQASDLELDLMRDADGLWHINGIGIAGGAQRQNISFGRLSVELWLDNLRVEIDDQFIHERYTLLADQLRVTHQGSHIRVGARVHRLGATGVLQAAGRFRDDGASGQLWFATKSADLHGMAAGFDMGGYSIDSGQGDIAVWMDWHHSQIVRELFQLDVRNLAVTSPAGIKANVTQLNGLAELSRHDGGATVRWADHDGGALRVDLNHLGTPQAEITGSASRLQLAPLMPWLGLRSWLSPELLQSLAQGQPHGQLEHAVFHWSAAAGTQRLDAVFGDFGIASVGKLPGVDHLHGEVRGDAEAVSLELPAQVVTINLPHSFRKPIVMSQFAADVVAWRDAEATHIGIANLAFEGEGYGGNAQGEIAMPSAGGRPFVDVNLALTHADIAAAKLFWPISLNPHTVEWLDQAFVSGRIDDAAIVVRGNLADWPFHHNEGRFEARADISDLTLSYGKSWPLAEHVQAVASFIDMGLLVEASGESLGVKVSRAVALIPELGHTTLDLNASGEGNASDLLNFVGNSPIANKHADVLAKLKLGGTSSFDFHLSLPVHDMHDFLLDGTAQFKDVDVSAPEWKLQLDKLNGPATFDKHGFHAGPLAGGFRGESSQVDLAIAGATGDPNIPLVARLDGDYTVSELLQDDPQLAWLGNVASGRSPFTIGYQIAHASDGGSDVQTLTVDSPLTGTALNFPVPLDKPADSALPLHVSFGLPTAGTVMQMSLGSMMRGRLRLSNGEQSPLAGTFAFGDQMPDELPAKGLRIRGDAPQLDVTGWIKQSIGGSAAGNGISLETIDVTAQHAVVFGRDFAQMHVTAAPKADTLELDVDSAAALGHFSVPTVDLNKRGITARLQRMYWPKQPTAPAKKDGEAVVPGPSADPAKTGIDPRSIPPLHFWAHDLRLDEAKLGEARLETWPTPDGMHIDQLSTQSRSVQVSGSGDWNGTPAQSSTHLRVDFAADNLGDMLTAFGFAGIFDGGKTKAELNATWPGGPWTFELGNMDGTLSVDVTNGNIPKASPGVGRLFGLASIAELPRRLSFNFNDVFGKGFGFDLIKGDFKLGNGNAYTDNLKIHGPAAEIKVTGRTGLRNKDYDQQMTVIPHIGNSLPVVGAVVGGPIGAAAGFAVQTVLGRGINHAATQRYRVTGSWDKPVITSADSASASPASSSSSAQPAPDALAPTPASSAAH